MSWEDIERDCRTVSKKILIDGFETEVCVAISRGGFPVARIICDFLNIASLASMKIEYYSDLDLTLPKPRLVFPLNADVKQKKVLIVDDVADRGDSLILARSYVEENKALETKLATLHYKPWSKLRPDYFAHEYRSWIIYPWEVAETERRIISSFLQSGKSTREIDKLLSKIGIKDAGIRVHLKKKADE
jgi:hypothetical protein